MAAGNDTQASFAGTAEAYCAACGQSFAPHTTHCPHDGSSLVTFKPRTDTWSGRILDGRYQIGSPLGEGGMGTVFRGRQLSVDREVAIKVLRASYADDRDAAKRFLREARLACRLNAPGVINTIDFGQTEDGDLYLVMELLRGQTLSQMLSAVGRLPPLRAIEIGAQLCEGLAAAHALEIVHRDLKPSNIMLVDPPAELVKILDFGVAKSIAGDAKTAMTNTNALMGTPAYMAPEQIGGGEIDARADLYALGCILHEMLSGKPPFADNVMTALLAKQLTEPPPPLPRDVPAPLAAIVARLLEKAPAARYPSALAVRDALRGAAGGQASTPWRSAGRAIMAGVAVLALGGGVAIYQLATRDDDAPRSEPSAGTAEMPAMAPVAAAPVPVAAPPSDAGAAPIATAPPIDAAPIDAPAIAPRDYTVAPKPKPKPKPPKPPKPPTAGSADELPFVPITPSK